MAKAALDPTKPIFIAQGRKTTRLCLKHFPDLRLSQIIACDVPTQYYLRENDLSFISPQDLLPTEEKELRDYENLAHIWAETWFYSLIADTKEASLEAYAIRDFFACFLVLLRGFQLLESIQASCPSAKIYVPSMDSLSLRFGEEDAPFASILNGLRDRYGEWDIHFIKISFKSTRSVKKTYWILNLLSIFRFFALKHSDVLLLGNPKLLEPVALELNKIKSYSWTRIQNRFENRSSRSAEPTGWIGKVHQSAVFQFDEIDFFPVVLPKIKQFYKAIHPSLLAFVEQIQKILHRTTPSLLICDEDVTLSGKAVVDQARRFGIKTLVVSHGYPGLRHGFIPLSSDAISVWGNYGKRRLKEWGIQEERIAVTGCPKYDAFSQINSFDKALKKKYCKKWRWNDSLPMVLIAPNDIKENGLELYTDQLWVPEDVFTALDVFIRVAKEEPRVHFLYKVRQGKWKESVMDFYIKKYSGLPPNFKILDDGLAVNYMKISDAVFTGWSSAALESILLKKPTFLMQFLPYPEIHPYSEYGLKTYIRSGEDAVSICRWIAEGTLPAEVMVMNQEALIEPLNFSRDGKAAARVAQFIMDKLLAPTPSHPEVFHAKS